MSSLDRILPFLKPIEDLLRDPAITEVMVNDGGRCVFVEREGGVEAVPDRMLESRNLTVAIKNIARACEDEISEMQPLLDARLEDGSRVAALFPPCAVRRDRPGPHDSEVHAPLQSGRPRRRRDALHHGRGSPRRGHQDAPERAHLRWHRHRQNHP